MHCGLESLGAPADRKNPCAYRCCTLGVTSDRYYEWVLLLTNTFGASRLSTSGQGWLPITAYYVAGCSLVVIRLAHNLFWSHHRAVRETACNAADFAAALTTIPAMTAITPCPSRSSHAILRRSRRRVVALVLRRGSASRANDDQACRFRTRVRRTDERNIVDVRMVPARYARSEPTASMQFPDNDAGSTPARPSDCRDRRTVCTRVPARCQVGQLS